MMTDTAVIGLVAFTPFGANAKRGDNPATAIVEGDNKRWQVQ
jgi:hypothetical protein